MIAGRMLPEFRKWARTACLEAARQWMVRTLGIENPVTVPELLIVTGHQPQLNHAGVWMKNVATARLAECCGGQGVNLIVDNDLAGPSVLRVPSGTRDHPVLTEIPFDLPAPAQPWEEVSIQEKSLFENFGERVSQAMSSWNIQPLIESMWPAAAQSAECDAGMVRALSAARITQERAWHVRNLELPVSELCRTEPFLAFVSHLCHHVEDFFTAYNSGVHAYRHKYRVRNARHPVPDLEQQGDRFELPFWYWEPGASDRQRVFVRREGRQIELLAGEHLLATLNSDDSDLSPLVDVQKKGRLRTRALTTTLFARLCLGDLFLHGIGGARYDEITNGLMASFFGIPCPGFITLTATLHLPIEPFSVTNADLARLKSEIRQLEFHGRTDSHDPAIAVLEERRRSLLQEIQRSRQERLSRDQWRTRRLENRQRHQELVRIQRLLAEEARPLRNERLQELEQLRGELRANSILKSREFSAALCPESKLQSLIQHVRREICGR